MLPCLPVAFLLFSAFLTWTPDGIAARPPSPADPGGVLKQLSVASFTGSGQNSIQAVATDASGNVYVAGTTSSADLPVKNAAQPMFGDSRILRTTDLGVTWTPLGSPPEDVTVLASDPVSSAVLFAGTGTGIYKSADGGQTWRLVYHAAITSLVVDSGHHLRLAALSTNDGMVRRSLDGGETWTLGGEANGGTLQVDPKGSGALLAGPSGAYWSGPVSLSRDWGLSFQHLTPPGTATPTAMAFDASRGGWLYIASTSGLFLSKDYGATWTSLVAPVTNVSYLTTDPGQPGTLFAMPWYGLFISTDGGASWVEKSVPVVPLSTQFPLVVFPHSCSSSGALLEMGGSASGGQLFVSPDFGTTWSRPQFTRVTGVLPGAGCTAYLIRQTTTDAFVSKLSADGSTLWTTYLGGSDTDSPVALVLDASGNVYVTGNTTSRDFPSTVPRIGVAPSSAVFVTRFSSGGKIEYSAVVSGGATDTATAIAVDSGQNAYVVGTTNSASFPATSGTLATVLGLSSADGFLLKLSPEASLVYATYLNGTIPGAILVDADEQAIVAGVGTVPGTTASAAGDSFVMKLDRAASSVVASTYIEAASVDRFGPTALAVDKNGNLLVSGGTDVTNFAVTPGGYTSPESPAACLQGSYSEAPSYRDGVYVVKLAAADWTPVYRALVRGSCGIYPGSMVVDSSGAPALALATAAGLPLRQPVLAGPTCSYTSSVVAKLSPDGSALQLATYLDGCGVPGIALAPDGSLFAGVSPSQSGTPAGVLHLNPANAPGISLDQISNAFSGDASAVVGGGLYTLTGSGFQAETIGLGLNPAQDLPTELGGIQVKFDGVPAAILQTDGNRVIVVPPAELPPSHRGTAVRGFTSVQVVSHGVASNAVWMPVYTVVPGLLARGFPNLVTSTETADADAYNDDGTPNDADHPAAAGSTVTVFVTGLGARVPAPISGSVARSLNVAQVTPVYTSWKSIDLKFPPMPSPETVYTVPGFVSAMYQIRASVPDSIPDTGVQRMPLWLNLEIDISSVPPPASNVVYVYVK